MSKLTSIISLAAVAVLLAGCASTSAEEPDTRVASESVAPSASPTAEATPEPTEAPSEEAPEPSPEPTEEPAPTPEQPEEPVPTIDPLPVGPNDPFVPPPHGEPNPLAPQGPGTPHSHPDYFKNQTVEPVAAGYPVPSRTMPLGGTLTIVGHGYEPGEAVYVMLGWPNTDYNYIQEPATAIADQNGSISFPVSISTDMPARDYVVMTVPPNTHHTVREAAKRYYNVAFTQ